MTDPLLIETAERAFTATATPQAIQAAEAARWAPEMWAAAAEIGLPWISVPESAGGAGGSVADAVAVLGSAGGHAVPLPLAETGLLAGWLLASAGLQVGDGPATVVPGTAGDDLRLRGGRLYGHAQRVPWAAAAERVVALVDGRVVVVAPSDGRIEPGSNLAGEPRDTVTFDGATPEAAVVAPAGIDTDALWARGALSRVALIAGGLLALTDRTVAYTHERKQFGRPVAAFQAVQAHLVTCAEEAALVDLAAQVAAREADRGPARFEIASAKTLANNGARVAARAAHQAHGAMGMTQEYPLHQLTRRLWSWRAEYGDPVVSARLGRAVAAYGADDLFYVIADGSRSGVAVSG
jgi:acyl-CoA dehydrogenase